MGYIVWTKDEFQDVYNRKDCADEKALKAAILDGIKGPVAPVVTIEVAYHTEVKLGKIDSIEKPPPETKKTAMKKYTEGVNSESKQSPDKPGGSSDGPSDGILRRGEVKPT